MTRTDNCQLPQWEETDRILMEDFNDMCGKIDAGITQAQEAAQAAQTAAEAAQEEAEKLPYVIGWYTGNGISTVVELGFKPRLVIVSGEGNSQTVTDVVSHTGIFRSGDLPTTTSPHPTGFKVVTISGYYPRLNERGRDYRYIAFR